MTYHAYVGIVCGQISFPNHGSVECSDGDNYNSVCQFECDEGYDLNGSESRTCLDDPKWSGSEAICTREWL